MSEYRAPKWLPGRHLQTIASAFLPAPSLNYVRCRWETPDGDFIDVDWARGAAAGKPVVVLFHGLEGHSDAPYARRLGAHFVARGWQFAVPHFRGCSGEPNRRLPSYHAGISTDVHWLLRRIAERHSVYAVGVSLGASALLKWLGERDYEAAGIVRRAVAISAPLDLSVTAAVLSRGFSLLYSRVFLSNDLRQKALDKLFRFPGAYDARAVRAAATLRDFDDAVTAPVHGFRDVDHYYEECSAIRWLGGIRVPTLLVNALNDPFLPAHVLRAVQRCGVQGAVELEFPSEGGHASFPGGDGWLARRVAEFLERK